jgi:aspartate--ammonia ligase
MGHLGGILTRGSKRKFLNIFYVHYLMIRSRNTLENQNLKPFLMPNHISPPSYSSLLDLRQTEHAIKLIKDFFESGLSSALRLQRVTAPLFVLKGTGINDDLTGREKKVTFSIPDMEGQQAEVVNSLAKWKRMMLADYGIETGYGIYTDMNAIRPDELLDNTHSLYVDQWDWELAISSRQRSLEFLKKSVEKIYDVLRRSEYVISSVYPEITPILPEEITFLHAEDLLEMFPDLSPKQREDKAAEKFGAIFIIGIGSDLRDGKPHDFRAPDYDDWITPTVNGYRGLNGDIILWHPVLKSALEISSMGVRVDQKSLIEQLEYSGCLDRRELLFHRRLLNGEYPLSIGGGIGQSRLCMFFLRKAHIGEIQSSVWPQEVWEACRKSNIRLI